MISLLKSVLPKASNPEEVEQVIKSHENQLARVQTHHSIMARFDTEPIQARKDHITFLENEGRFLFSEARRQHDIEAAQWEVRSFETFEAMSQHRQQMTMDEYRHWLEHNMVEFTCLRHHSQLTAPIRWEQQGVQLSGRVCHRQAGCFKKNWASGITALSEADNPGELQNQSALMVLLDGVADLEKLRRQALTEIQAQQQQLTEENRLFMALETLGRGEDPLTQGIERAMESMVRISYQHFPQGTEWVLNALSHVDSAIDATVEYIDDKSGHRFSTSWRTLDETTQARTLGAGKLLSVMVPITRAKLLAEIKSYLDKVDSIPKDKLVSDMEKIGLTIKGQSPDGRFVEFTDKKGNVRAKIHPPDKVTRYHHLHLYGRKHESLSKDVESVDPRSPEAHIKISGSEK